MNSIKETPSIKGIADGAVGVSDIYDDHQFGIGDIPAGAIPGVRTVSVPGLKSERGFRSAIRTGKPVRKLIHSLHGMGEHVGLRWSANEITVFVAKNRNALIGAGVIGATAIGGAIYLTRRRSLKK